jgi:hypothetical protein
MGDDLTQQWGPIIMILTVILACIYIYFNVTVKEGLETANAIDKKRSTVSDVITGTVDNPTQQDETLKNDLNTMKHSLNISTNRTEYENIIINTHDLMNYAMLKLITTQKINKGVSATRSLFSIGGTRKQ